MSDAMKDVKEAAEFLSTIKGLLGIGGTILCLAGAVPRAGPLRAVMLALRSKVVTATEESVRTESARAILTALSNCKRDQYLLVAGPMGVGKSCLIETVLQRTCGVITVTVNPGASPDVIVDKVLKGITRIQLIPWDPAPSARRVLFFYRFLPLERPIVVLQVVTRMEGDGYAGVAAAARQLTAFGLRVVVDLSTNSLPVETTQSLREKVFEIEPMLLGAILNIPENKVLFETLDKIGLSSVVWAVLGGIPAHYDQLRLELAKTKVEMDEAKMKMLLEGFVKGVLGKAIGRYSMTRAKHPTFLPILDMFKVEVEVSHSVLADMELVQPSLDKVLRVVSKEDGDLFFIPADPAMAMVLCHGLQKVPPIKDLLAMTVE